MAESDIHADRGTDAQDLGSEETKEQLAGLCRDRNISCPLPHTNARLLDRLGPSPSCLPPL
eukprot:313256-Rhodomonas_salina.1